MPAHHGLKLWPARPHCAQEEGEPRVPPASCESPPPPLGRAARVRVSDTFHLLPNCYCDRQGIGCHPRGVHLYPAGASPSRKRWTQTLHRQHSCLPGQAKNETAAMLSQSKFFHRMWTNLFAVAGIREHPPAGVIRKRGRSAPSCARGGRAGRIPAREARVLSPPPFKANPGRALRAPTGTNHSIPACAPCAQKTGTGGLSSVRSRNKR